MKFYTTMNIFHCDFLRISVYHIA